MRGKALSVADLLLFSHLQTITSGVGTTEVAIRLLYEEFPILLRWARRLNADLSGFPWLFTRPLSYADDPDAAEAAFAAPRFDAPGASLVERAAFCLSLCLATTLFLPLTLAVLAYAFAVRMVNPHRSLASYEERLAPAPIRWVLRMLKRGDRSGTDTGKDKAE